MAEREANGPYTDFYDFCQRVDTQVLNKRTVESLIKAGAFDDVGHPRKGLLAVFEQIVDHPGPAARADMGIMTLFGDAADGGGDDFERTAIPDVEFGKRDRLAFEKEMLGLYVSDHPLLGAEAALARRSDVSIDELSDLEDGALKSVGGVITNLQRKWTRKGDLMAVFTLEDLGSSVEVMVFPRTMTEHGHKLADDAVVVVKARVDTRDDAPKLIAQSIDLVDVGRGRPPSRCGCGCRRRCCPRPPSPTSSPCWPTTRAPRRCCCTSASGRWSACPTSGTSTRRTASWASLRGAGTGRHRLRDLARRALVRLPELHWPCGLTGLVAQCRRRTGAAQEMSIAVDTKDCTALSDAEMVEMADLCAEGPHGHEVGTLSKQAEAWVLVTQAREESKLKGFSFCTLERIGGTPCVLIGLASVKRTAKRDTVLRALVQDLLRRAVLAFPDEDVLVGTRFSQPGGFEAFGRSTTSSPGPATGPRARSGPGAGAWPSASASRPAPTTSGRSWPRATAADGPGVSTTRP